MAHLLPYQDQLQLKNEAGKRYIYCPVRRKYLILAPEEVVRQLLIIYLTQQLGYPLTRMSAEVGIRTQGTIRRYDLVVYDKYIQPFILCECKSYQLNITEKAAQQIAAYNQKLLAPYLILTNGPQFLAYNVNIEEHQVISIPQVPHYSDISG